MDNQDVRDHKELVARLRAGEANIRRKIEFDPPISYSRNTYPEVNYAGGISEEHYGREARSYGPGQKQYYPESNGPKANQWGEGNPTGESITWRDIYPITGKENEGRYEKPPDYGQWRRDNSPEAERSKKETLLCLAELLDMDEHSSRKERKERAMTMLHTAKEEARKTGNPWEFGHGGNSEDEAREFAETYAGIIMDEGPPRETCPFPGVVPKGGVATRANMRRMERCLREAFAAHMVQFEAIASWTRKEKEILRWYEKTQATEKSLEQERNTRRRREEAYTRDVRRSLWSVESRGEGDKPPCKDTPQETQSRERGGGGRGQQEEVGTPQGGQQQGEERPQGRQEAEQGKGNDPKQGQDNIRLGTTSLPAPFNNRMEEDEEEEEEETITLEAAGGVAQGRNSTAHRREEKQEKGNKIKEEARGRKDIPESTRIMQDVRLWEEESVQRDKMKGNTSQPHKGRTYMTLPQGLTISPADVGRRGPNVTGKYAVGDISDTMDTLEADGDNKQQKTQGGGGVARATEPPEEKYTKQERERRYKAEEPHAQGNGQRGEYTKGEEERRRDKESLERLKRQMERFENRAIEEWMEELIRMMKEENRRRKEEGRQEKKQGTAEERSQDMAQPGEGASQSRSNGRYSKQGPQGKNKIKGQQGTGGKEERRKPPQGAKRGGERDHKASGAGRGWQEEDSKIRGKGTPGISRNGRCMACGEEPHSRNSQGRKRNRLQDRERACKAWNKNCNRCGSRGHLEKQCRTSLRMEEEATGAKGTPQGEGEDRNKETGGMEKRRWQHPGDHQDRGGDWERQYGGNEDPQYTAAEGEAEAAGATTSTLTGQCMKDTARECAYGMAPQYAPEEWAERNRRERGMPPMIRLPEDTEEEARGLEEPQKKEKKTKKKWSIRIVRGKKETEKEKGQKQASTGEEEGKLPMSILKKTRAEGRTVYSMDSQEARDKEEQRCRERQSYYVGEEGGENKAQEHEEVSDVENESGYESYFACKEEDEEFFKAQEKSRNEETEQGNGEGGETELSPPPAVKEGGQ